MKTEYLITFDSKDAICTNAEKFKSLLAAHTSISFVTREKISFAGYDFSYQLAQGALTDMSIYYDLTIASSNDAEQTEQEAYKELLKEVRSICTKNSGRKIIVLHDGMGESYCQLGYPIIYKTENLMRKLIAKFMAISIGYEWSGTSTPKEVIDSVRSEFKKENINILHDVDFIQLSNFLFNEYSKADSKRFIDSLKGRNDDDTIRVGDIKQYQPFTNWEKYFSRKVECDSAYLKSKWAKLYEYRCKIAHCKGITKLEFDDLKSISIDVCEKIEAALDSIDDVHIEEVEREELAENFSGNANKNVAEFIAKYNKLVILSQEACELSSNVQDTYKNHDTNKTNIQMQSKYLHLKKGVIDKETSNLIDRAQKFRNKVIHKVGIVNITESEIIEEICSIDVAIDVLLCLNPEDLKRLQGVHIRNS